MTIHWILFLPGLLLLLYPADRLLSSMVQLRSYESFVSLENSPRYRPWWWVPILWIDPLRGLLGTWLIRQAFAMEASVWTTAPKLMYGLTVLILAVAVLCQTLTRRDRDALLAPIGFVAGIVAALMPMSVALIAFSTALMSVFAFRRLHAFFTVSLVMIALLAVVFDTKLMWLAPALIVVAMPIMLGLITGSSLEIPTRNDSGRR